jgi:hypothetical protein
MVTAEYRPAREHRHSGETGPILRAVPTRSNKRRTIGWREWVALPELGIKEIKAKVDTGADNSSLHAFDLERYEEDGRSMVRFAVHPHQRKRKPSVTCVAEIVGERMVKNPGGRAEKRPVIRTRLVVAGREFEALVNLTTRDEMTFRMLLGRRTVRGNFLVDPGRSYLGERPTKRDT